MTTNNPLLISTLGVSSAALKGETVMVTGAGGGIGLEAARALLWMGANVVIAEINEPTAKQAVQTLSEEFDSKRILFVHTDVGDEASVRHLYDESMKAFKKVDAVINNATIAVLGRVIDLPIQQWDASYRVNLRGPVLMARAFLPGMIANHHGAFICVSSTGTAFLGGYETFKAAQVHLANTLESELEGTGVQAFTIGPGLVPTETATKAVAQVAPDMGMSLDEFYRLNQGAMLSVEEAGVGFALSVIFAEKFNGQEISSMQAIKAADINYGSHEFEKTVNPGGEQSARLAELCAKILSTLKEQSEGWKSRSIFERQWVIRDFKKTAGMPAEEWLERLTELKKAILNGEPFELPPLEKLAKYYEHLADLAKGYEKDPQKLADNLKFVYGWRDEVSQFLEEINAQKVK